MKNKDFSVAIVVFYEDMKLVHLPEEYPVILVNASMSQMNDRDISAFGDKILVHNLIVIPYKEGLDESLICSLLGKDKITVTENIVLQNKHIPKCPCCGEILFPLSSYLVCTRCKVVVNSLSPAIGMVRIPIDDSFPKSGIFINVSFDRGVSDAKRVTLRRLFDDEYEIFEVANSVASKFRISGGR